MGLGIGAIPYGTSSSPITSCSPVPGTVLLHSRSTIANQ